MAKEIDFDSESFQDFKEKNDLTSSEALTILLKKLDEMKKKKSTY